MKKKLSILRPSEISLIDLLLHLLKNGWVILLIALAAAMTVWSLIGSSMPEQYSGTVTLSVRSTLNNELWNVQLTASNTGAMNLTKFINNGTVNTDFASDRLNKKINAVVTAEQLVKADKTDPTNLLTVTATAQTKEDVYFYLTALADNADRLISRTNQAALANLTVRAVTTPVMPESVPDNTTGLLLSVLAALVAGFFTCALMVLIYLTECRPVTRKAADRLLVLPIAGALNKGGRGKGIDACLPLPVSDKADGRYTQKLTEAEAFLLKNDACKHLQVVSLVSESAHQRDRAENAMRSAERIALNLALIMADKGAKVCLVDKKGEALAMLGIKQTEDKPCYTLNGGRLTVCTSELKATQTESFDKIVSALPKPMVGAECHTLWVISADRFTADQINGMTAPGGGAEASASLLLYGLHSVRDTVSAIDQNESNAATSDDDEELDLLRWGMASLKAMWRFRYKWIMALGLALAVALTAVLLMRKESYQTDTVFAIATADVTADLTPEQLDALTIEEVTELMSMGTDQVFNGDALYPTARPNDVHLLSTAMPMVWNSSATTSTLKSYLGKSALSANVSVSLNGENGTFTLSVRGSDQENLKEITEAFFEIAPSLSAHTAGGLTFFVGQSNTVSAGMSLFTSVLLACVLACLLVLMAGCIYALVIGYNDRTVYMSYEVREVTSAPVVGKCVLASSPKDGTSPKNELGTVDVGLARFVYDWAEKEKGGRILMITSALRHEGTSQLAQTVEKLLKQNGKTALIADKSVCDKLLTLSEDSIEDFLAPIWNKCDFLLLDCPGMAVDSDAAALSEKADGILWTVRIGYADEERITAAVERLSSKEKALGCVMMVGRAAMSNK